MRQADIQGIKERLKITAKEYAGILGVSTATLNRLMGNVPMPKLRQDLREKLEALKTLADDESIDTRHLKSLLLDTIHFLPLEIAFRIQLNSLKKSVSPSLRALEEVLRTCLGPIGMEIISSSLTADLHRRLQMSEEELEGGNELSQQEKEKLIGLAQETYEALEKGGMPGVSSISKAFKAMKEGKPAEEAEMHIEQAKKDTVQSIKSMGKGMIKLKRLLKSKPLEGVFTSEMAPFLSRADKLLGDFSKMSLDMQKGVDISLAQMENISGEYWKIMNDWENAVRGIESIAEEKDWQSRKEVRKMSKASGKSTTAYVSRKGTAIIKTPHRTVIVTPAGKPSIPRQTSQAPNPKQK